MCFSSGPSTPQAPSDFEYVDSAGTVVPFTTKGATKRRKVASAQQPQSILTGDWSGSDAAGNSAPGGEDASGNASAGSSASGW